MEIHLVIMVVAVAITEAMKQIPTIEGMRNEPVAVSVHHLGNAKRLHNVLENVWVPQKPCLHVVSVVQLTEVVGALQHEAVLYDVQLPHALFAVVICVCAADMFQLKHPFATVSEERKLHVYGGIVF